MAGLSFDDLKNRTCAITGGAGILGAAIVHGLAAAGMKVAVLDIALDAAQKLAAEVGAATGATVIGVKADVLSRESLKAACDEITRKLGPIDILINGAGGNSPKATTKDEFITSANSNDPSATFFGLDIEGFRRVFDLNFIGTILPTMVLADHMVKNGKGVILNISSMNSFRPLTKIPAYSAGKAAINNFTEWLAVHLAKVNVRVNAIAPGFFLTNQNRFLRTDEKTGALTPRGEKIIAGTPMGRFGEPEDLMGTILYLLSDVSGFVTGVVIPVDGGFNAYSGV